MITVQELINKLELLKLEYGNLPVQVVEYNGTVSEFYVSNKVAHEMDESPCTTIRLHVC